MSEILGEKYELVRKLGEGGMGSVWHARNRVTGKRVALKRMSNQLIGNAEAVERFLREARAATQIEHPNVVQIFDVGVHDGAPFMVMEYLEGEPFSALRARLGAISPRALVELLMPVMLALDLTHTKGIVHRDLKPDNIHLVKRGARLVPKLLDFGISKIMGEADLKLTRTGTVMGTPYYMAPEQASGRKDLDHRADVYAIGVILYEGLTGRLPFEADNYNALIVAILTSDAPPVSTVRPDVPAAVSAAVERAMERDVSRRFPQIADLARALGEAVGLPELWEAHPDSAPEPDGVSAHSLATTLPAGSVSAVVTAPKVEAPAAEAHPVTGPMAGPLVGSTASAVPSRTTLSGAAREVTTLPPAAPASGRGVWIAASALAAAVAAGAAFLFGGAQGAGHAPPEASSPPSSVSAAHGDTSRTARALACTAEGQDRCVVDVLLGHEETETDTALLVDALRRLGDREAAGPLAHAYVTRWPEGPRAREYATWLAELAHEAETRPPQGEPLVVAPPPVEHGGHRTRSVSPHTAAAEADDRAAIGAAPPPPSSTGVAPPPTTGAHRSGGLDPTEF